MPPPGADGRPSNAERRAARRHRWREERETSDFQQRLPRRRGGEGRAGWNADIRKRRSGGRGSPLHVWAGDWRVLLRQGSADARQTPGRGRRSCPSRDLSDSMRVSRVAASFDGLPMSSLLLLPLSSRLVSTATMETRACNFR